MRSRAFIPLVAVPTVLVVLGVAAPPLVAAQVDTAVLAAADSMAMRDLWPGFDPRATPVAIFDGARTLLVRHPSPPAGFTPQAGVPGVSAYRGRWPAVSANSSAEIGGVMTATLMPGAAGSTAEARAGVLLHETFHVFQRRHHPGWSANEAELFTYPVADAALLALRREEGEALARALRTPSAGAWRCWARVALRAREQRFAEMTDGAARYEWATEWNEGLANYVQARALGTPDSAILTRGGYAPQQVRQRAYASGTAIARLLDRAMPAWRDTMERRDTVPLHRLLRNALGDAPADASCSLQPAETAALRERAAADVSTLRDTLLAHRQAFLALDGWRVVIDAAAAPLFPRGFDPLNVELVAPGEVLHARYLALGGTRDSVEIIGHPSLTGAAGLHPLFSGVRALTVAGLTAEPVVAREGKGVRLTADGVTVVVANAGVERQDRTIVIRLR